MASRTIDCWMCQNTNSNWTKGQLTYNTTSPYIITAIVTNVSPGGTFVVDGETVHANELFFISPEDPIQPSVDPYVSYTTVATVTFGTNPPPITMAAGGTKISGMWVDGYYSAGAYFAGAYTADYVFETYQDLYDALEAGEIVPINTVVYFDVYIDGTDQPSLFVNWTAGEDLSPVTLTPKLWPRVGCLIPIGPEIGIDEETGLHIPNYDSRWDIGAPNEYSYAGSVGTNYVQIYNDFEQYLNPISKVQQWGIDGIPNDVGWFMQMNDGDRIGEIWKVVIEKDGTPSATLVADSTNTDAYKTFVRFHTGEPDYELPDDDPDYPGGSNIDDDGPGAYNPDDIPDPDDFTTPNGFDGNSILTTTYAVSASDLINIGNKLWSQAYFNVLKIQSNPIENIVSVKAFPFAQTGTSASVKVGDIDFGVTGAKVSSVWTKKFTNTYTYLGKYGNFLDFAPFTKVKIFLPYIGFCELDPAEIYGRKLSVEYVVDLVTGQCMARLFTDANAQGKGIPFQSFYGNMGIDIPLTATDRVQTEIRSATATFSAAAGAAGHIMGGDMLGAAVKGATGALNVAGMDTNSQRTSAQSPVCGSFDCQDIYIIVIRPAADVIAENSRTGYEHLHGYPTNKYMKLSSIGEGKFVQVDRRTDIKIAATSEENALLEQLLMEGVYV